MDVIGLLTPQYAEIRRKTYSETTTARQGVYQTCVDSHSSF